MSQDTEPHINLNQEHDNLVFQHNSIPDTLYRLRLSVLKDNQGHHSCPSQMFTFTSLQNLESAAGRIAKGFGSGLNPYVIQRLGALETARGTEDGRTEDLTLEFDTVAADESWDEFLGRVRGIGEGWQVERSVGKGKVHGQHT